MRIESSLFSDSPSHGCLFPLYILNIYHVDIEPFHHSYNIVLFNTQYDFNIFLLLESDVLLFDLSLTSVSFVVLQLGSRKESLFKF